MKRFILIIICITAFFNETVASSYALTLNDYTELKSLLIPWNTPANSTRVTDYKTFFQQDFVAPTAGTRALRLTSGVDCQIDVNNLAAVNTTLVPNYLTAVTLTEGNDFASYNLSTNGSISAVVRFQKIYDKTSNIKFQEPLSNLFLGSVFEMPVFLNGCRFVATYTNPNSPTDQLIKSLLYSKAYPTDVYTSVRNLSSDTSSIDYGAFIKNTNPLDLNYLSEILYRTFNIETNNVSFSNL